ncbi:hypothetical protein Tco_1133030 [Tanacetum coccineum]|uniref:Uncharacterized protein n=1 Tax=Tanacetum coccineum TaxID=301880 RepID=A0ABQ5JHL7_9ASTR
MIAINNRRESVSLPPLSVNPKKGKSQTVTPTLPKSQALRLQDHSLRSAKGLRNQLPWLLMNARLKPRRILKAFLLSDNELDKESDEEEVLAAGEDMDEDTQTDKLVEASMSFLNKSNITINDLYKGLNVITELLKDIYNSVKDDLTANQKINDTTETFTKISSNITKAQVHKQDEISTAWTKSFANLAWNLGSRMTACHSNTSLTHIPANVEGENATHTTTEETPSHTEGETDASKQEKSEEPNQSIDANIGSSTHQPPITQA